MEGAALRTTWDDEVTRLIQHGRDREAAELASTGHGALTQGRSMDPRTQLDEILPLLDKLVAGLDREQLQAPTACVKFTVGGVLDHMIGGATQFAAAFRGETATSGPEGDPIAAFPEAMAGLRRAVHSPGALERIIASPFGDMPGETFARLVAMDGLVHGWDIARATRQSYEPRGEVVAAVDAFTREALTDDLRDGDTFAAAVNPPPGSSTLERLVAFTGRTV